MALRTYYEILGVSHNAVEGEIRRGYRRAVQEHHPDQNPSGAKSQKRIRELNAARETLLNSALREKYDAKLRRAGLIPPENGAEPDPAETQTQPDSEELDISESDESVDAESVAEGFASQSFEPELESTTADWNTSSSNTNRHKYSGEKRKQRFQLLVTLVMIPTGGIAGIAVAVLLLWVGFRLDPLGLFQVDGTPVASNSVDPIPSTDPLSRGSSVANTFGDPLKLNQSEPVAPKIILLYHSGDTDNQKEVASPRDGDVLGDPLNLNQTQPAQEEPPTTDEEMQKFHDKPDKNNQKKSSGTQGSDPPPIIKPKPKEPTAPADQSSPEVPATTNSFGMSFAKLEFLEPPQLEKLATGAAIHSDRDSVWAKMPVELVGLQVTQWKVHQGQADVSVTTPGYVIMATSPRWGGGGEKDGIWDKELTTEKDLLDDGWVRYTSIEEVTDDPENPFLWPVFVKQFEGGEKLEIRTEKYLAPRFFFPPNLSTKLRPKVGVFDLLESLKQEPSLIPNQWQNLPDGFRANVKANHVTLSVPAAQLVNQDSYTLIYNLANVGRRTGKPRMRVNVPYTDQNDIVIHYYYGGTYTLTVDLPGVATVSTRKFLGQHSLALHITETQITARLNGELVGTIEHKRENRLTTTKEPTIRYTPISGSWMHFQLDDVSAVTFPERTAAAAQPTSIQAKPVNYLYSDSRSLTNSGLAKAYQQAWADRMGLPAEFENSIGMKMRLIPPGTFMMGGEIKQSVVLDKPYYIGTYEVTQQQYMRLLKKNPSSYPAESSELGSAPVETVTWDDAVNFCKKLTKLPEEKKIDRIYRLPSEAEWEYACRAGTTTLYSFGDDESKLGDHGWFRDNSDNRPHSVGLKTPNPWGLYDMHGNLWEWCLDWHGDLPTVETTDPTGATTGIEKVRRGGTWNYFSENCQSSSRASNLPSERNGRIGFRVVLPVPVKFYN